jgi:hypothetical protein
MGRSSALSSGGKKVMADSRLERRGGKWAAPRWIPCYGEGARLPLLLPNVNTPIRAHCGHGRSAHASHIAHSTRVVGKHSKRNNYKQLTPATRARALFGPSPTTPRTRVWPRPGGSCRCTKYWAFSTPYLCTGSCSHTCGKACRGTAKD